MSAFDYKDAFGYDFSKLSPEQRAKADAWLNLVATANAPDSYPNAANAKKILEMKGGLNASTARQLSAYSAYKAQLAPLSKDELGSGKVTVTPEQHDEYRKRWIEDHASQFNGLVKVDPKTAKKSDREERAIEMEPVKVTAPPPVAAAAPPPPDGAPASQPASAPASQPAAEPMPVGEAGPPLAMNGPSNWTRQRLNPETGQYEAF